MASETRSSWRWSSLWALAAAAATSSSWIQPVAGHSRPQVPHKRAHVPTNLSYTLIRRGADVAQVARRSPSPGELIGGSFKHVHPKARKRSSPPSPFQVLDGKVHQPHYADTILVQFDVPDPHAEDDKDEDAATSERISMLLRPTQDLLHPDAKFVYTSTDPITGAAVEHAEPIQRESVLAYSGYVLREDDVQARLQAARIGLYLPEETQRGWARLTLNQASSSGKPLAEGAFELDGEMHHVKSYDSWMRSKRHPDGYVSHINKRHLQHGSEALILLRDRDLDFEQAGHGIAKRELDSQSESSCAHDKLEYNTDQHNPIYEHARQMSFDATYGRKEGWLDSFLGMSPVSNGAHGLVKRQNGGDLAGAGNLTSNFINSIGSTTGCPKSPQVLYMGLAADCTYTANYGDANATRTQLLTNINTVSALYQRTFNVSLGVVELNVQDPSCPSSTNSSVPWNVGCGSNGSGLDLNGRLSAFSQWRGRKGGSDGAGLWHLFSDCSSGSEVGVAWLGTLCRVGSSTSSQGETTSGTGVTTITDREWQVFAHEVGHNFGAIHDCRSGCSLNQQCCPLSAQSCNSNGNYIMSPVSQPNTNGTFSPCSVGNICSGLGTTLNTTCLYTPGNREVISLNQCGNGILEPGEECDPGQNESSCCNRSTCKLNSGALCDPATSSCCTSSCQYAPTSRLCRPAVNEQCDIAEYCTGSSGECPEDKHKPDGESCGSNGLQCANGYCTSKDEQCRTLGASNGITKACSSFGGSTCQVTCQSPSSSLSCVILEGQNFVAGTSCGYGGRCDATGNCVQGNWTDTVSSWYRDNLRISIPVTVVGGIIVLLILFGILRCCFRRCGGGGRNKANSSKYYSGAPPVPPQPMQQPQYNMPQQPYPTYGNAYPQNGYR